MTTVEEELKTQENLENLAYLFLFIFIAGFIGDLVVHYAGHVSHNWPYQFAKSLMPYYKSLEFGHSKNAKLVSSIVLGGIWGGVACVVALVMAKFFMYIKEKYVDED